MAWINGYKYEVLGVYFKGNNIIINAKKSADPAIV